MMTIQELYQKIDGDYEQAIRVLRVEKLVDKHIRKLPQNGVVDRLIEAGQTMNPEELFESAHAVKGVCANLGLTSLSEAASEISEEFRPGNGRRLTDEEVTEMLHQIEKQYRKTVEGLKEYEQS